MRADYFSFGNRPKTLSEVASRVGTGEQEFGVAVREFLDSFYLNQSSRNDALRERPRSIDAFHDAYFAAVGEHLARTYGLQVPQWTEDHGNGLHEPYFAGGLESLKAILFVESPLAFRRRLLFVSRNALTRASMLAESEDAPAEAATPVFR
jgi:hypothetical protein